MDIAPITQPIPKLAPMSNEQKAEAAAKDFEAVYISQMLTHMFEGIKTDGMFGGIGIASAVQNEILEMQSQAQNGGIQ